MVVRNVRAGRDEAGPWVLTPAWLKSARLRSCIAVAIGGGVLALSSLADAAPPAPGAIYVAMGSSYAAGTALPTLAENSPAGCGQGSANYPRQVARVLGLQLIDRSCGGSTSAHILDGGQFGLPAQLAAVTSDTQLVTITTGGNDVRFVADLGLYSCNSRPNEVAEALRASACRPPPKDYSIDVAFAKLESGLRDIIAQIRERAPRARVMVVDYVTLVPPQGGCPALGFNEQEASIMRERARRLAELTARVASAAGADLIEASTLTRDHNACSAVPWVWGFVSADERARTKAVGFHPRLEATTAIANAIVERLQSTAPSPSGPKASKGL